MPPPHLTNANGATWRRYVALSKVEGVLKLCPVVEYPMVYAESTKDYCVALVCPNHGMLKNLAKTMVRPHRMPST